MMNNHSVYCFRRVVLLLSSMIRLENLVKFGLCGMLIIRNLYNGFSMLDSFDLMMVCVGVHTL